MQKNIYVTVLLFLLTLISYSQSSTSPFTDSDNELILIEGRVFEMGNNTGENRKPDERPVHNVMLSDFYISKYEITVNDYRRFCNKTGKNMPAPPENGWKDNHPITNINWYNAIIYCNWLSKENGFTPYYKIDTTIDDPYNLNSLDKLKWKVRYNREADGFRLPFEAEWEFVARGGKKGTYFLFGEKKLINDAYLNETAWYNNNNKPFGTKTVGLKKPNEVGIYDLFGNVTEWCNDWYNDEYYNNSPKDNPHGPQKGENRVIRGGYFNSYVKNINAYNRNSFTPDRTAVFIGFRVCRDKK